MKGDVYAFGAVAVKVLSRKCATSANFKLNGGGLAQTSMRRMLSGTRINRSIIHCDSVTVHPLHLFAVRGRRPPFSLRWWFA